MNPNALAFTVLIGALGALPALSIDMSLPALADMGRAYGVSPAECALTLSSFMAGFALTQLGFGALSERFGRRPILLVGLSLFAASGFAAAFAPTLGAALLARFFQGAGAGAGNAMMFAIVRDCFEGDTARTKLAYVSMVLGVAPMVAPALGATVLRFGPWPAIYLVLAAAGVAQLLAIFFGFAESRKSLDLDALSPARLIGGYARVIATPVAIGNALVGACVFGCMFAYISGSANLMMHLLKLSAFPYAVTFALSSGAIIAGTFVSSLISRGGLPATVPLWGGLAVAVISSCLMVALTLSGSQSVALYLPLVMLASSGFGLVWPNATHGALQPLPRLAGVTGATIGFLQMTGGSLSSGAVARFDDGVSPWSMAVTMAVFSIAGAAIYGLLVRPAEIRSTVAG
jgi:DHA1 family bicyclomycin/chloramphenicol resistance-like MFS transporter